MPRHHAPGPERTLGPGGDGRCPGFSETVTRAAKVLKQESYAKRIMVESQGQVADDAKLGYLNVKSGGGFTRFG